MRRLAALLSVAIALLIVASPGAFAQEIFFDDRSGGTELRSITGRNEVSFTETTAVFSSSHDGIMYSGDLLPAEGVEVLSNVVDRRPSGALRKDTRNDTSSTSGFLESFHRERSGPAETEPGPHGD
jgi:hypothetical protein